MRIKLSIILCCVISSLVSRAQVEVIDIPRFYFKTEVTTYVPSYFPYVNLEVEWMAFRKWSIVAGGGPMVPFNFPSFINGMTGDERKGFVLNPSIKYYLKKSKTSTNKPFIGLQFDYRECSFNRNELFFSPVEQLRVYNDTIQVHHKARGFTVKYGIMAQKGNFGFEFTTGIGIYRVTHHYSEETIPGSEFADKKLRYFWQRNSYPMVRLPVQWLIYYWI